MHKGPKCIQTLWDHQKRFLLLKTTKNARDERSLGKKPHVGAFLEAEKGVGRAQVRLKYSPEAQKNANQSGLS